MHEQFGRCGFAMEQMPRSTKRISSITIIQPELSENVRLRELQLSNVYAVAMSHPQASDISWFHTP